MNLKKMKLLIALTLIFLVSCQQKNKQEDKSKTPLSSKPEVIKVDVIVPEHGMADPHAWVQNDTVFIICGHDESWEGKGSFRMDRWEVWSSVDLKNWEFHRSIFPSQTYIGNKPNCWAGDVCERDGKYYWFFSNRNINTGVMVADEITGEYKDLLGKPLLDEGIVPVHPYDPEIYIENDVYTICFGAGTYYMATLAKDMKSLTTAPKKIIVKNDVGKIVRTGDKPTLFKRNDWYYLVYGSKYAMSKNLYGPYAYKGAFLKGGHTSFFKWYGQLYVLQENHDISAFFRGASLKPVFFNADQTIQIPKGDRMYPGPGRPWEFKKTTMGWQALNGTDISFYEGKIKGTVTAQRATLISAPWLYTDTRECSKVTFKIKNNSNAKQLKFSIFSRNKTANFWRSFTEPVDWSKQEWVSIPIHSNDTDFQTYTIALSKFKTVNERLMQIALQPISDASSGNWEIDEVIVK